MQLAFRHGRLRPGHPTSFLIKETGNQPKYLFTAPQYCPLNREANANYKHLFRKSRPF
jgi:hypothetical protein